MTDSTQFSGRPENSTRPESIEDLGTLLSSLPIGDDWDYLLIGDGSATTWEHQAGWASTLIERHTGREQTFYGAMSSGTNIVAELMAYVHPFMWLMATSQNLACKRLHVITDCKYLPEGAASQARTNQCLWAAVRAVKSRGLSVKWHWFPRDIIWLNRWAHDRANAARRAMKHL